MREREVSDDTLRGMRIDVLGDQLEFVREKMASGEVSRAAGERYASTLNHSIDVLKRGSHSKFASTLGSGAPIVAGAGVAPGAVVARPDLRKKAPFTWTVRFIVDKVRGSNMTDECKREMSKLIIAAEEHALQYLESIEPALDAEGRHAAGLLKSEYNANLMALRLRVARVEAEAAVEAREEAREAAEEKCAVLPDSTAKLEL